MVLPIFKAHWECNTMLTQRLAICQASGCRACLLLHTQALAEQHLQLESSMSQYAVEVQQASLTVLAWQAHMAALYASPRYYDS